MVLLGMLRWTHLLLAGDLCSVFSSEVRLMQSRRNRLNLLLHSHTLVFLHRLCLQPSKTTLSRKAASTAASARTYAARSSPGYSFFGSFLGISRYCSLSLLSQSLYHTYRLVGHLEYMDKELLTWRCSFLQQHHVVCHEHDPYHPAHSLCGFWFWSLVGFTVRYSIEFSSSLLASLS